MARRKKHIDEHSDLHAHPAAPVEFCVNCNDIEDMAVTDEPAHLERIRKRFEECERTGKFQGELCARLYIAADENDPAALFEDEE